MVLRCDLSYLTVKHTGPVTAERPSVSQVKCHCLEKVSKLESSMRKMPVWGGKFPLSSAQIRASRRWPSHTDVWVSVQSWSGKVWVAGRLQEWFL